MDLLTDLLQGAMLRRRLLDQRHLGAGKALNFACDKSIGLHVVVRGTVYLHAPKLEAPIELHTGDVVLMARGCTHLVSTSAKPDGAVAISAEDLTPVEGEVVATLTSGAYQFWHSPVHPFFSELPDWFVLRTDELPRLAPLALALGLLGSEVQRRDLGADMALHGLLDLVFTYTMRELIEREGLAHSGWSHAIRDGQVGQVVSMMHENCSRPWTLEELAEEAGLSRTTLAERFRDAMGDTPLHYLRTLRMQRAMRLLSESERNLESIASEVGYQDAFSFSKVFKRTVGVSPRDFRQRDGSEKRHPWRIQA